MPEEDKAVFKVTKKQLIVGIVGVFIVIGFFAGILLSAGGNTTQPPSTTLPTLYANNIDISRAPMLGDPNAKVNIVIFEDFECSFCKAFSNSQFAAIKSNYVATGKAKVYFMHFPLTSLHPFAEKAAEASMCAADQGKFWEYHDALYVKSPELDILSLKRYAVDSEMGMDAEKFNQCLDSGSKAALIQADYKEGQKHGVQGTPTVFINGNGIEGAQPYPTFKAAIESQL